MKTLSDLIGYLNDRDCRYVIIPSRSVYNHSAKIVVFNRKFYDMKMNDLELTNDILFVPFIELWLYEGEDDIRLCVSIDDKPPLEKRNRFNIVDSGCLKKCLEKIGA